jgi:hypothetical protein
MRIPFVGLSYVDRSLSLDAQRTVNFYPVKSEVEDSKAPTFLRATPGLFLGQDPSGDFIGYDLDSTTPVSPPDDGGTLVPCGEPFILDLTFPGSVLDITTDAIYTFTQDVRFPIQAFSVSEWGVGPHWALGGFTGQGDGAFINGSYISVDSSINDQIFTATLTTNAADARANISNTYGAASEDYVYISVRSGILPDPPDTETTGFIYSVFHPDRSLNTWLLSHYEEDGLNEYFRFSAGESLYLAQQTGIFFDNATGMTNLRLHLVGEAAC